MLIVKWTVYYKFPTRLCYKNRLNVTQKVRINGNTDLQLWFKIYLYAP